MQPYFFTVCSKSVCKGCMSCILGSKMERVLWMYLHIAVVETRTSMFN